LKPQHKLSKLTLRGSLGINVCGEPPVSSLLTGGIGEKKWLQFENIGNKIGKKIYKIFYFKYKIEKIKIRLCTWKNRSIWELASKTQKIS